MVNKKSINFGKVEKVLPKLDLSLVQRESWEKFLAEDIAKEIAEISPINDFTGKNWQIILENPVLNEPKLTPKKAQEKGLTYSASLKITATLLNKKTGERKTQDVFLGDLPQMTSRGTFVINGVDRVVINQIVRSPGVYFSGELDASSGRMLYMSEVRPLRGSWLEFAVDKNDVITARIDRRRKIVTTVLLRALGISENDEIKRIFKNADTDKNHKYIEATLEKDPTESQEEALLEIYRKVRPGEPAVLENAQELFETLFFDPRRYDLWSAFHLRGGRN